MSSKARPRIPPTTGPAIQARLVEDCGDVEEVSASRSLFVSGAVVSDAVVADVVVSNNVVIGVIDALVLVLDELGLLDCELEIMPSRGSIPVGKGLSLSIMQKSTADWKSASSKS